MRDSVKMPLNAGTFIVLLRKTGTNNVDKTVNDLCARISEGDISIKPKITKEMSACTYCRFSRICMFDIAFSGCSYEKV